MLPDDVLLEIFDFYLGEDNLRYTGKKELWIALAHACRRWRSLVFQSPHRLNLRLVCTPNTRARDTLDIWPPLPLIISDDYGFHYEFDEPQFNIIAALEHNDRVCKIDLCLKASELESVTDSAAMQKPFPELTDLQLLMRMKDDGPEPILEPILPDSFLAGTAPRLRSLDLGYVSYPGIPKLLLSTTHLVRLDLDNIPPSGYIPPEAMATGLSALASLEFLGLRFRSPRPRPALESRRQTPPPLTRSILPSLTQIRFKGVSEYLEEILARIDAPRVKNLNITFFNQITFDIPQLFRFISRRPTLRAPEKGHIGFDFKVANVTSQTADCGVFRVDILCMGSEWQLSSLEQICTSPFSPLSTLEDLYISEDRKKPSRWQDNDENTLWLELLRPFATVKNLYLSDEFMPRIATALQELAGPRTTEVLPALENIFLEGFELWEPLHEGIEKFVTARRLPSHPVAVSLWDKYSMQERFWEVDEW
jgi:hypothetical protein